MNIDFTKKHLVLGLGATGQSIIKTLQYFGVQDIWGIDTRADFKLPEHLAIVCSKLHCGGFSQDLLNACDYLWISPGISMQTAELQTTLDRLASQNVGGDIELFARINNSKVAAITGTNGKSTVTSLLAHVAQEAGLNIKVGGNLGEPALELYLNAQTQKQHIDLYVLELSSFQLDSTSSLQVQAGAILNIEPDHLDRYDSFEAYQRSKLKLFEQAEYLIINADDPILKSYLPKFIDKPQLQFSIANQYQRSPNIAWNLDASQRPALFYRYGQLQFDASLTSLDGFHNYANILAVCAMVEALNIPIATLKKALPSFIGLAHRCVLVRNHKQVRWYNDSKATNIPSTMAALKGFSEKKWLILGGLGKDQDFTNFHNIVEFNVIGVALIGQDAPLIEACLPQGLPLLHAKTLENAVNLIAKQAQAGEIVLLSPACASMDQFKSYEERGKMFTEFVMALS